MTRDGHRIQARLSAHEEHFHSPDNRQQQIRKAVSDHDIEFLAEISRKGLRSSEERQLIWPLLAGVRDEDRLLRPPWIDLPPHKDEAQVALDTDRSFVFLREAWSRKRIRSMKVKLNDLIIEVLRRHPMLSYFQGFHDICQELLLTLDFPTAVLTAEYIALHNIRDTMLPSIEPTLGYLRLLPSLLLKVDDEVGRHLGIIKPFYALPFFLTWFAHDMRNREALMRLFDLFIPTHPCMPIYMIAATILCRRELLLDISESDPETLHSELGKLPLHFPTEDLIHQAVEMFNQHSPSTLDGYADTPRSYCLKTFMLSGRTLSHGDELLDKAIREGMAMEEPVHRTSHGAGMQNRYMVIAGLLGLATVMFGVYGRSVFEW